MIVPEGKCHEWLGDVWAAKFPRDDWSDVTIALEEGYCPKCGTALERGGKTSPQVPWARAEQAERILGEVGVECIRLNKAVDQLAEELAAAHEVCPFETEQGCPRPDENYNLSEGHHCDKSDRRSLKGTECWRLWAEAKRRFDAGSNNDESSPAEVMVSGAGGPGASPGHASNVRRRHDEHFIRRVMDAARTSDAPYIADMLEELLAYRQGDAA